MERLPEIDRIAREAGLAGLIIVPHFLPDLPLSYGVAEWQKFRSWNIFEREKAAALLARINYDERDVFFTEKKL